MKIAFWSNSKKAGVTGCVSALSLSCILGYGMEVTLLENEYNLKGLSKYLLGYQQPELAYHNSGYYSNYSESYGTNHGLNTTLTQITNKRFYDSVGVDILSNRLFYVWQGNSLDKASFDFDFYYRLNPLLKSIESQCDFLFIDTACNNMTTIQLLNEADLVVVVLKQDQEAINHFFQNYSSLVDKAFFILSGYQVIEEVAPWDFAKSHNIAYSKVSTIPFCKGFELATKQGKTTDFFKSNYIMSPNYDIKKFMQAIKKTNMMLIETLNSRYNVSPLSYVKTTFNYGGNVL